MGTNITVKRFPVPTGTNSFTVTIRAVDQGGNTNTATQTWAVNPGGNAPQLSSFNIEANMQLPDVGVVWVEGVVDDGNAVVSAVVSSDSGDVTTNLLSVHDLQFKGSVPLEPGTNQVVLVAFEAAGDATSNLFTLVRSDRFRALITTPAIGDFATAPSSTVGGYVSALVDQGLPTETNVVAVLINGVEAVLDWDNTDENNNVPFATTNAVPLGMPITGQVLTEADLSSIVPLAVPPAPSQQYQVLHHEWHEDRIWGVTGDYAYNPVLKFTDCSPGCSNNNWQTGMTRDTQDDTADASGPTEQYQQVTWGIAGDHCVGDPHPEALSWTVYSSSSSSCGSSPPPPEGCSANLPRSGFFGMHRSDGSVVFSMVCRDGWDDRVWYTQGLQLDREWDRSALTFLASPQYDTNTTVLLTFEGMDTFRGIGTPSLDLSQVTYRGQPPVAVSNAARRVSYLVNLDGNAEYTINQDSLDWPTITYPEILSEAFEIPFVSVLNAHWLQWTNFSGKLPLRIIWQGTDITSTLSNTVIVGQQVSLQAVLDPSLPATSNFAWSVDGWAISNYVFGTGFTTAQVLPLTQTNSTTISFYWVSGGQQNVSCTVVLPNGMRATGKAGFSVNRPNSKILPAAGSVACNTNFMVNGQPVTGPYLHYGDGLDNPGMYFHYTLDPTIQGSNQWVQIADPLRRLQQNSGQWRRWTGAGLDSGLYPYPWPRDRGYDPADSPAQGDESQNPLSAAYTNATVQDSFQMWLMFMPTNVVNSVWVPLRTVSWGWSGTATRSGSNWTGSGSGNTTVESVSTNYPEWTRSTSANQWQDE